MPTLSPEQARTPAARQAGDLRYGVAPASRGPSVQASLPAHSAVECVALSAPPSKLDLLCITEDELTARRIEQSHLALPSAPRPAEDSRALPAYFHA